MAIKIKVMCDICWSLCTHWSEMDIKVPTICQLFWEEWEYQGKIFTQEKIDICNKCLDYAFEWNTIRTTAWYNKYSFTPFIS